MTDRKWFESLESAAKALIEQQHGATQPVALEDNFGLDGLFEFTLCGIFWEESFTAGLWCDGVASFHADLNGHVLKWSDAYAWIGDHASMWKVPVDVSMEFSSDLTELRSVRFHLGDAQRDSLKGHEGVNPRIPDVWLHEFTITRPPPDDTCERLTAQLTQLVQQNETGRVFGPDWEPITVAQAKEVLSALIDEDTPVDLVSTWLDGAPALSICVPQ